jgi:hypothetical protein
MSKAIELADELDAYHTRPHHRLAAMELRRLDARVNDLEEGVRHLLKVNAELLRAAQQALSDFEWIEKNIPKSNFQSSIILLRRAIQAAKEPT